MIEQPPEYDERYTYDYEGIQHTRRPEQYSSMVREAGTGWTGRVKKVAAKTHLQLWRITIRLKNFVSIQSAELCANRDKILRMDHELKRERARTAAYWEPDMGTCEVDSCNILRHFLDLV